MEVQTLVTASDGSEESWSTFTDADGLFLLRGLPEGVYDLTFEPETDSGLSGKVLEEVAVTLGEVNDVGTIDLEN